MGPSVGSPQGQPSARTERSEGGQKPAHLEDRAQRVSDKMPAGPVSSPRRAPVKNARRDVSLDVRLTRGEKARIAAHAEALGVRASALVRAAALDVADSRRAEVAGLERAAKFRPDPQLGAAVEQLRRVGVVLNQEVRDRRRGDGDGPDDELLVSVVTVVDELRATLGDRTRL